LGSFTCGIGRKIGAVTFKTSAVSPQTGPYDTCKWHEAIAARNAHTVIPPRKNAKPRKPTSAGAIARNDAVKAQRYLGRTVWRCWSGYRRRSRVETTSSSAIQAYETKLEKLEAEKILVSEKFSQKQNLGQDFDKSYRTALELHVSSCNRWIYPNPDNRKTLLKLVLATPLPYARNRGFRTAKTTSPSMC